MKAMDERYELVSVLGKPALFTSLRIERDSVPAGIQLYEVRHEDDNGMAAAQIGRGIMVNHMGTLLMRTELPLDERGYLDIADDDLVFTDSGTRDLGEYIHQYPLPGQTLDAANEVFEERLVGDVEQERVLYHSGHIRFSSVPDGLKPLYAYESGNGYGTTFYLGGQTVPADLPFAGTYITAEDKSVLLAGWRGELAIASGEIYPGRAGNFTLQDYMKENGLGETSMPKKKKQEPER